MTVLIAEIGLNHMGDEQRAHRMLARVLEAGADFVTFQIREPKFYESTESSHRRLSLDFYREVAAAVHKAGRQIGIAIADPAMVESVAATGVDFWKSLSWDFQNEVLRKSIFATGRPVFLSTGLSSMETVVEGSRGLKNAVLIHTQLSQKPGDVNLKAIPAMAKATGLPVAFGLHCENHDVLQVALAFEPHSIFFYVKETGVDGLFDDHHALPLDGLAGTVRNLKDLMQALGTGEKREMEKPGWVVK
jgi:N-acetylneuraminate synthase